MGRGRKRSSTQVTEEAMGEKERREEGDEAEIEGDEGKGFFACYLLCSLSPRRKGHTYIGFTVNPRRRIKQHNGEMSSGAWRTKHGRPWEMILCIYGFPSNVAALQFEWAWQHPIESLAVRKAASTFKSLSGIANKIKLAYTMLLLPAWENLKLTVNFFSTKYMKYTSGCPKLPKQTRVIICEMDELPCYVEGLTFDNSAADDDDDDEDLIHRETSEKDDSCPSSLDTSAEGESCSSDLFDWRIIDNFGERLESKKSPCKLTAECNRLQSRILDEAVEDVRQTRSIQENSVDHFGGECSNDDFYWRIIDTFGEAKKSKNEVVIDEVEVGERLESKKSPCKLTAECNKLQSRILDEAVEDVRQTRSIQENSVDHFGGECSNDHFYWRMIIDNFGEAKKSKNEVVIDEVEGGERLELKKSPCKLTAECNKLQSRILDEAVEDVQQTRSIQENSVDHFEGECSNDDFYWRIIDNFGEAKKSKNEVVIDEVEDVRQARSIQENSVIQMVSSEGSLIDLSTPPICKIRSRVNKDWTRSEIVDLTDSPVVIQL